ncbi:hypothetical protein BXO8_12685 [Xanthomonas oryzae pv. oryzae]|nr:hypothetical protein APZ20_13290 [Xanthomonas oryzae pv. oryzae]BAE68694.1 conserved hypothetical protein [Xanthomonas oryzae pv. oryzae MAFF 311018]AOS02292.1 hypothetical protein ATY42_09700 [Xanthomonas oryzae pv. oryzae]AOS05707.1 hypothetical protein ATY43_05710 [Xanthomonas oryzae pv. oryzae]AOS11120.1 hypothetical protein ATY44_13410 [Xanthomonas oryzae pv. oryzae]
MQAISTAARVCRQTNDGFFQDAGELLMKLLVSATLSGNADQIGNKIEAEADTFKNKAMQVCDQLATLRTAQNAAAQLVPAFAPYSRLTQNDIDDCRR